MSPRSAFPRPAQRRARRTRAAWSAVLPLVLTGCTSVVTGTPQVADGALVERPLPLRARVDLAEAVISAHAALSSMTRTTVHRDPVSTDEFRTVETRVGDRVDRLVSFAPATVELWTIEEIRCVDRRAYATPGPEELHLDTPWVEVPIDPTDAGTDAGAFIAYSCDYGYAEDLAYDVTFLDEAQQILDLGADTVDGVPVRRYRVELDALDSAAALVGTWWVHDDTLVDRLADTITVDITVDGQDRMRTLDSTVVADGGEYGDSLALGGFDEPADVSAPDPAEVSTP